MAHQMVRNYVNSILISSAAVSIACGLANAQEEPADPLPTTGDEVSQFAEADKWMQEFLAANKIPGGSLAIAVDGQIKLARGYGYADRDAKQPVEPSSLFRVASVSKPITAVAVLKLADEGKLKLDDKIVDVLKLWQVGVPPSGGSVPAKAGTPTDHDPWWDDVTLFHLLTHTGGWDRNRSGDPMFMDQKITAAFSTPLPATHRHVIDFQFTRGIDFAPGERYVYSNFGYCLLGRAIEQASGQPYEQYVKEQLFAPLGITSARIGGSLPSQRCEGEVCYYTIDEYKDAAVVGPSIGLEEVPGQYGGWQQELLDSHGGWIMSSIDLVKFALALDEMEDGSSTRGSLLKPETARTMFMPQVPLTFGAESQVPGYGLGWVVARQADGSMWAQHGGALPCTAAILGRLEDRVWIAALFNLGRTADDKWLAQPLAAELPEKVRMGQNR